MSFIRDACSPLPRKRPGAGQGLRTAPPPLLLKLTVPQGLGGYLLTGRVTHLLSLRLHGESTDTELPRTGPRPPQTRLLRRRPQDLRRLYLEAGLLRSWLRLDEVVGGGRLIPYNRCLYRKRTRGLTHAQRGDEGRRGTPTSQAAGPADPRPWTSSL